jgi:UDP-glucose 4-epimerase
MPLTWIVGRGGLLGSAAANALGATEYRPGVALPWSDLTGLPQALSGAVAGFAARVASSVDRAWAVLWCAGAGVVGTNSKALAAETAILRMWLDRLGSHDALRSRAGVVALASSAGGVYAGSTERPITEATAPRAISPYGRAKLEQEEAVRDWARARSNVTVLIGRFSNIYGPGQRLDKPQGLISHMSRCVIFGSPLHIYVPLDTIRDYIFADDAGSSFVSGVTRLAAAPAAPGTCITRIYASEQETSIAGLLGLFRRMAKRQVRAVIGRSPVANQQPDRLNFRSTIWHGDAPRRTELLEGIARVYRTQLLAYQAGGLPRPHLLVRPG